MIKENCLSTLKEIKFFFENTTRCLTEENSQFAPVDGMFTTAQQIAHVAQVVDWFMTGMFDPKGFDMNFEEHTKEIQKTTSVQTALDSFKEAIARAITLIDSKSELELQEILPENPILGKVSRANCISALADHTAHHRGALSVYARLCGKTPAMPYVG